MVYVGGEEKNRYQEFIISLIKFCKQTVQQNLIFQKYYLAHDQVSKFLRFQMIQKDIWPNQSIGNAFSHFSILQKSFWIPG